MSSVKDLRRGRHVGEAKDSQVIAQDLSENGENAPLGQACNPNGQFSRIDQFKSTRACAAICGTGFSRAA